MWQGAAETRGGLAPLQTYWCPAALRLSTRSPADTPARSEAGLGGYVLYNEVRRLLRGHSQRGQGHKIHVALEGKDNN